MPFSARDQHRAKRTGRLLFALICSLLLSNARADEAYDQGIQAFNRGDYTAAITHFLASSATDPSLDYNLGASYYKLGRYEEAGRSFLKITATPEMAALGYYNLALVAAHLDQPALVINWLHRAIETSDSPKLQSLARAMLERYSLQEDDESEAEVSLPPLPDVIPMRSRWSGFLAGEMGYDSNVILRSDSQTLSTSEQDDFFFDAYGYVNRRLGTPGNGVNMSLDGNIYVIKYRDIEGYDTDSLRMGGIAETDISKWRAEGGAHIAYTFLDGDEFTVEPQLNLSANRWLQPDRSRLRLRYELSRVNALDTLYAYLNGWRHRMDARMTWVRDEQELHFMYQLETNYREELYTPRLTSYSPIRNSLRVIAESPLGNLLYAAIEVQYHHSHYMNPNELADGSFVTRSDNRLTTAARLTHRFAGENELSLEYRRSDNKSNIEDYEYTQYITMLGLLLAF